MGALDYLSKVTPATRAIAEEVHEHLERVGKPLPIYPDMGSQVMWGFDPGGAEHGTGRAIDFMIRNSPAVGDEVAEYLWANRERFGLILMIWKRRIKSTKVDPGNWRYMGDRGTPTNNHMDHVHALFTGRDIGRKPTSVDNGTAFYKPTGVKMSVEEIQKAVGVPADGYYGPATKAAVRTFQVKHGLSGSNADGFWGPQTEAAYSAAKPSGSKPSGSKPKAEAKKFPLPSGHWYGVESKNPKNHSGLDPKDRPGIKQYQTQMATVRKWRGMGEIDGIFGEKAEAVTKQFQKEKGLKVDGDVGAETWKAAWAEDIT